MSLFEDAMSVAVQLPTADRVRLAQALGVPIAPSGLPTSSGRTLPMNQATRPDPVAWRKAETGHAVLNTAGGVDDLPAGPDAIAGMWAHRREEHEAPLLIGGLQSDAPARTVADLPPGTPVVAHIDICMELALGIPAALEFWRSPPVEVRLATGTYLALLGAAENEDQVRRIRRFVQPYAVLSLGPMASSRAVELMLAHTLENELHPLDALIAATALAHEIPLLTRHHRLFQNISGLDVRMPYGAPAQSSAGATP